MLAPANGEYEVTAAMLRREARVKASTRTILRELHARKSFFRRLREKPLLTKEDIKSRLAFARKDKDKTAKWWNTHIDMHIDLKHFPVLLHGQARSHGAREGTSGAYRTAGQGLGATFLKHGKRFKYNRGARSVMILAGVGHGKVLLWKIIDGSNWSGDVASEMYSGPIKDAHGRPVLCAYMHMRCCQGIQRQHHASITAASRQHHGSITAASRQHQGKTQAKHTFAILLRRRGHPPSFL